MDTTHKPPCQPPVSREHNPPVDRRSGESPVVVESIRAAVSRLTMAVVVAVRGRCAGEKIGLRNPRAPGSGIKRSTQHLNFRCPRTPANHPAPFRHRSPPSWLMSTATAANASGLYTTAATTSGKPWRSSPFSTRDSRFQLLSSVGLVPCSGTVA
ncbi:hypothetical protein CC78DRAFT_575843 [Lojkania enalia]|uniref:Uncharacterized protein n=1 Tax=Lojkania enalia TaxID=147567 RepID=A0A9P4N8E2_9PLEO|nr:hypothetical protein CC78DRAFT_575843 [Didymosphaeria enalia]